MKSTGTAFLLFISISSLVNAEENTSGKNSSIPAAHNGTTDTTVTPISGASTTPSTSASVSTIRTTDTTVTPISGASTTPSTSASVSTISSGPIDNPASSITANTTQKNNGTTAITVTPISGASTIPNTNASVSTIRIGPTDNPASSTTANTTQKNNVVDNTSRDNSASPSIPTIPVAHNGSGPTNNPASSITANTTQKNNGTILLRGRTYNKISEVQAVDNTSRDNSASPSIPTIPVAHNGLDSTMTRTTSSTAGAPQTSNHKILWVMLPVLIALVGIVLIVMKFKCFTDKNNQDASENDTENVSKDGIILLGMKKPGEETGAR